MDNIYFFELKKLDQKTSSCSRRELWLRFIKADKEQDFNMLDNTNDPVMKKAVRLIFDMSEETTLRENALNN